jgi:hypothetical protein
MKCQHRWIDDFCDWWHIKICDPIVIPSILHSHIWSKSTTFNNRITSLQYTSRVNIQILHKQQPQWSSSSSRSHCPSAWPPVLASTRHSQFDNSLNQLLHWPCLPSSTVEKPWRQHWASGDTPCGNDNIQNSWCTANQNHIRTQTQIWETQHRLLTEFLAHLK